MPRLLTLLLVLQVGMTACGSDSSTSTSDAGKGGAGGVAGSGGTGGASGKGGAGGGGVDGGSDRGAGGNDGPMTVDARDAANGDVDASADLGNSNPADARADRGLADAPFSGGPGCGAGSTCQMLRAAYADAILAARCGFTAAPGCAFTAPTLGCSGCPVCCGTEVGKNVAPLKAQFSAAGCDSCFYGSVTGDHCHPVICANSLPGE